MEFVDSFDIVTFHFVDVMSTSFLFLQFIDLCILLGCDYCDSIKGTRPKRAMGLIKQH